MGMTFLRHFAGMQKAYHKGLYDLQDIDDLYSAPTMSLEFALQYTCPLRANYSEQHLRQWGRLSSLHAKLTTGDDVAP